MLLRFEMFVVYNACGLFIISLFLEGGYGSRQNFSQLPRILYDRSIL